MKILIVSGFLGAGKTTFIKELIRRSGVRPVIMENEYGDNTIDARELERQLPRAGEMKILEFMEGCVCCSMKDSFVNSVLTVFSGLEPEYLVIEPTGVGRLSNILANLQPILHENISLLQPVAVIAPRAFAMNMLQWPELYADQIKHAQIIIFSKCENEDPAVIEETAAQVRRLNPAAQIISEHYRTKPEDWWRSLMDLPALQTDALPEESAGGRTPEQIGIRQGRLSRPAELIMLLEDCLRGELGLIARAKGTLPVGGEMLRFDLADGLYAVTGSEESLSQCVVIGRNLLREEICRRFGSSLTAESFEPDKKIASPPVWEGKLPRRPFIPQ